MATVPVVRWAFFPLDEQLGLRPKVGFTPKVEEGMARLGTWMPFRAAQRELAFFLGVEVAEATVRQITEQAGAAQMQVQATEVEALLRGRAGRDGVCGKLRSGLDSKVGGLSPQRCRAHSGLCACDRVREQRGSGSL